MPGSSTGMIKFDVYSLLPKHWHLSDSVRSVCLNSFNRQNRFSEAVTSKARPSADLLTATLDQLQQAGQTLGSL